MLQEQGLGDDGVDTGGSHQLGDGDDELKREERKVTHPEGRLPGMPRTRLLADGASRYDLRTRTPHLTRQTHCARWIEVPTESKPLDRILSPDS